MSYARNPQDSQRQQVSSEVYFFVKPQIVCFMGKKVDFSITGIELVCIKTRIINCKLSFYKKKF